MIVEITNTLKEEIVNYKYNFYINKDLDLYIYNKNVFINFINHNNIKYINKIKENNFYYMISNENVFKYISSYEILKFLLKNKYLS